MIGGEEEEFVTVSQEIKSRKLELGVDFYKEPPAERIGGSNLFAHTPVFYWRP